MFLKYNPKIPALTKGMDIHVKLFYMFQMKEAKREWANTDLDLSWDEGTFLQFVSVMCFD